jgi:hypothetical protein
MAEQTEVHTVADWITDGIGEGLGSIMIKTREPHGDPVELSHDEAIELSSTSSRSSPHRSPNPSRPTQFSTAC